MCGCGVLIFARVCGCSTYCGCSFSGTGRVMLVAVACRERYLRVGLRVFRQMVKQLVKQLVSWRGGCVSKKREQPQGEWTSTHAC